MGWLFQYKHIGNLETMKPSPRVLLGKILLWTFKRDGECVTIWINEENNIQISSKNNIQAQADIIHRVTTSEDYPKIVELLKEYPQMVCYVEECPKGLSVTRVETFDRTYLFLFDMYDRGAEKYLGYTNVHQYAFHFNIPVVKLWAKTRHTSMKSLRKMADECLIYCKENHLEGMVIKPQSVYINDGFGKHYIQSKVKQDVPKRVKTKMDKGAPKLPAIPENEVLNSINKAHQDLGDEKIKDVKIAMPLIAKYVSESCKQHFYSKPPKNLYSYYTLYISREE